VNYALYRESTYGCYHVVVSPGSRPSIHEAADVSVDGVDVRAASVHRVNESSDCVALRRPPINAHLARVSQLVAVSVVSRQIDQEITVVPLLHATSDDPVDMATTMKIYVERKQLQNL